MQHVDTSGFISADDGVGEAQERLSKQRLHKSGSYDKHSLVCFKGVVRPKGQNPGPLGNMKNHLKFIPIVRSSSK